MTLTPRKSCFFLIILPGDLIWCHNTTQIIFCYKITYIFNKAEKRNCSKPKPAHGDQRNIEEESVSKFTWLHPTVRPVIFFSSVLFFWPHAAGVSVPFTVCRATALQLCLFRSLF
uniref:Putative secreted protein n=1 Tax=Ixodes ricinus TaxID=34613 RepID=A0A6B0UKR9_IXORI